jgi:Ni2+-binding GTPase involved in maturation of urease and hydrogenase
MPNKGGHRRCTGTSHQARQKGDEQCDLQAFNMTKVREKIHGLMTEAAAGPVGTGKSILLNELVEELSPALVFIYWISMDEGMVSEDWRVANMTPTFKKGKKSCPIN